MYYNNYILIINYNNYENVIWSLVHYPFGFTARLLIHVSFWGRERRMAFVD